MSKSMGERICESKEYNVSVNNTRKQKNRDKQMSKKLKEIKKENIQIILMLVLIVLAIVVVVMSVIKINNKEKITLTDDTILTTLDVNEYAVEIKNMYDRENQKILFKKEMDRIQSLIGTYIIENMTITDGALEKINKDITKELKKEYWSDILTNKSTYYVGEYSLDEKCNIKFKFALKEIEPSWINDEDIKKFVILN